MIKLHLHYYSASSDHGVGLDVYGDNVGNDRHD